MIFRDLVMIPLGNLWRIKLRSFLTMSGVMIAIGAFVAMLSFGAGNQQFVTDQWNQLGLFNTMYVYPPREEPVNDTTPVPALNDSAINWLAAIPGVELAYPFDSYELTATLGDTVLKSDAQALPKGAADTKLFSKFETGRMFNSDSAKEVVVTKQFLERFDIESADSVIGQKLIVSVERVRLDSGLVAMARGAGESIDRIFVEGWLDSLDETGYLQRLLQNEAGQALSRFTHGFFNSPAVVSDTLIITGVLKSSHGRGRLSPILLPVATAKRFAEGGLSNDPTELYAALTNGTLILQSSETANREYPRITLQIDRHTPYQTIKDSVETRGWRTFSYAEEFEQITKFFLYFDMALALIGLIALTTASLGIVNTMVMSIMERRREIGVLKSLGASERDIKVLYLFESALIGSIGAVAGILLGWAVARISSAIAKYYMAQEGMDPVELFALPWWLIATAFAFGLIVSIAAGAYPAGRAARVDPMEALRAE